LFEFGVIVVVYFIIKYFGGYFDVVGGVIVCVEVDLYECVCFV